MDNIPEIRNPEIELHRPEIQETVGTREDVRKPSLAKRFRHFLDQIRKQGLFLTLVEGFDQTTRLTTGAPTLRFSRITPDLFVGGQYIPRGWPILQKRGVTATISLRGEFDDREMGIEGMRYLYLPTVDNHAPTLEQLRAGTAFIQQQIEGGGKVYIHCWEGVGRAPTMAAAYLVSTGMSPSEAWGCICQSRPFIRPSIPQIEQIDRFALKVQGPATKLITPQLHIQSVEMEKDNGV